MESKSKERTHYYVLPDGQMATNMKEACIIMKLGPRGFRALVRNGIIKKVNATPKTEWYGTNNKKCK